MSTSSSFTRLQTLLPELFQTPEIKGERHLRFSINNQISALIGMETVQESLLVSASKITPIPSMPSSLIGLMSSRYSVFCVFDLPQLIGLSPLSPYLRQYHIVVMNMSLQTQQSSPLLLGMAVDKILGCTRVLPEDIVNKKELFNESKINNLPKNLKKYFNSIFRDKKDDNYWVILETQKIFDALVKSNSLFSPSFWTEG